MSESYDTVRNCAECDKRHATIMKQAQRVTDLRAKVEALTRWIPVSERLPEPYTEVYIWPRPDFGVTHHTGYLSKRKGEAKLQWFNNTYETNYGVEENTVRVTHWMPLPAPPKQEVSDE